MSKNKDGRNKYEHKPIREFKASLSKDRKFWVFKDITTHIVPCSYLSKIENSLDEDKGEKPDAESSREPSEVE